MLKLFYPVMSSIISYEAVYWGGCARNKVVIRLDKLMKTAGSVVGEKVYHERKSTRGCCSFSFLAGIMNFQNLQGAVTSFLFLFLNDF